MIVSASRRTDIPAFFSNWFVERVKAGYFCVRNPFNPGQVKAYSLLPEDVDLIVFWTKNPQPLLPYLDLLDSLGYRYYFQFTLNDYPGILEPRVPPLNQRLDAFRKLSDRAGKERVIWRYDPIVLSSLTPSDYHLERIQNLAEQLTGYTDRLVISFLDFYGKVKRRLKRISQATGIEFYEALAVGEEGKTSGRLCEDGMGTGACGQGGTTAGILCDRVTSAGTRDETKTAPQVSGDSSPSAGISGVKRAPVRAPGEVLKLAEGIRNIAESCGMEVYSCAETIDLRPAGIKPGACIDGNLIRKISGTDRAMPKDKGQRPECRCVESVDMGAYNTCNHQCAYCYANYSASSIEKNLRRHVPTSPLLVGTCEGQVEIIQ
ncbi:MAG TPA: DUF1848 domain-containing protein [Firmicutes bacterium]|nr:DUF1848 domain-containing protein [Candidatus Fermentithermobacillaceae bacterium]